MSPSSLEKNQKEQFLASGHHGRLYKGAHSRGCDKDKERETSFDSDDEFFSQDASLFMLNEVRIDRSTAEWNIKKEFQLRLKHSKMDIIY